MPTKKAKKEEILINPFPDYTPEEAAYRSELIRKLTTAQVARDSNYREFNDTNYTQYYDSNLRAANSYIEPKRNPEDTRVVTGTTEEKGSTLLSAILNYNLEPNIMAFDKEMMEIDELGKNIEDLVKKSREIENYEEKRVLIYKEMLDQGTCFVEEQWVEETKVVKKLKDVNWSDGVKVKSIKWDETDAEGFCGCQTRLIRGDKVYLGDVREFQLSKQPYIFTLDKMSYAEAETIYKNWDRWEFVPKKIVRVVPTDYSTYRDWTLEAVQENFVEVIKFQNKWTNEFMIMLNGVMMLPCGFPLEAISPSGDYTVAKGDVYPISQFFAYSKSIPAKTKVDQAVLDEMMKLIVLKTRKSYMPPMANNTGRVLSRKIFNAGEITNQIDPAKLQPIGDATGVTASEFNAFEFIKSIVDQKSVSPAFAGDQTSGTQTATEILELKKQQMMKLGLVIYGIISLEKQLSWLRTYNILTNWTKKQDTRVNEFTGQLEEVFKTIEVESNFEEGQKGKKIIQFSPEAGEYTPEQIMQEESMLSEQKRMPVRKTYISPEIAKMKNFYYINITPVEKETSDLQKIMFKTDVQDAMNLFGAQSLNFPYLMKRYAVLSRQNPEKFFIPNAPVTPSEQAMKGGDNNGLGAQLNRGIGTSPMGG